MVSTVVLAQADSAANWVSAVGTWFGGIMTAVAVGVALWISHRDWSRADSEQRDQKAAQARLVTIAVIGHPHRPAGTAEITNHSEQPVHQPRIESMGDPRPPVRWRASRTVEVLAPHSLFAVDFDHLDADGHPIGTKFDDDGIAIVTSRDTIKKRVTANDVTITFIDMAGLRWRRTGNGEPVRVLQPAPGPKVSSPERGG